MPMYPLDILYDSPVYMDLSFKTAGGTYFHVYVLFIGYWGVASYTVFCALNLIVEH